MKRGLAFFLAISLLGPLPLLGEAEVSEPYNEEEFPGWSLDLRRGEIIFFGSLPFATLLTTLVYQTVIYTINQNSSDKKNIPWGELTTGEETEVLFITLGLSFVIAVTDFILGKVFDENTKTSIR